LVHKLFSSANNRKKFFIVLGAILILLLLVSYFSLPLYNFFKNPDRVKEFVLSFGIFSPVVLILLQILQVLFAPIPGQIAGFVSGYIYGTVKGTVYTMIGTVLGSLIAFILVRRLGRPFVEKVIDKKTLKKFDYLSKENGTFTLFLIYLLPALPDDAICLIAGLTNIPIWKLVLITFFGRLPGFIILNMVGSGVANSNVKFSVILLSILMVLSLGIYIYRKKLENIFIKILKTKKHKKSSSAKKKE